MKKSLIFSMIALSMLSCGSKPEMTAEEIAAYNWIPSEVDENPIVERLSAEEIEENRTPVAKAYNFVNALLNYDEEGMKQNIAFGKNRDDYRLGNMMMGDLSVSYNENFKDYVDSTFTDIIPWKVAEASGNYVIAPVLVLDISYFIDEEGLPNGEYNQEVRSGKIYLPDEDEYKDETILAKTVIISCVPVSEIGVRRYEDISRIDDRDLMVDVEYVDGKWEITRWDFLSKPEMTTEEIAAYNWIPSEVDWNPIVERMSTEEIEANRTPAARAYNFVNAILNYDEEEMMKHFELGDMWIEQANSEYGSFKAFVDSEFSEGKLGILPWKELVATGDYEIIPVFVQDESDYIENGSRMHGFNQEVRGGKIYLPDEDQYKEQTILGQRVYIKCVPKAEIGVKGFQDISRIDDTNVKVVLEYNRNKWGIKGFI